MIAGDFVTTEDGTGLVHIAPAFGEDDYRGRRRERHLRPDRGERRSTTRSSPTAHFDDRVIGFAGRFVKDPEVTRELIADLERRGLLFREQVYEHSYPHCWRCGTPLLYYATSSWYIRTSEVKEQMLANNETIGWHPEHVKHGRFGKWLENNVDWALSRDRYWGTPLPIWQLRATRAASERFCVGSVAELRERSGGEVPDDLHRPYIDEVTVACEQCGGEMRRVESVIDTWYDSGAMPFAQFHYPFENEEEFEERFPADYICEAQDQTRGWFYTLLAESTLLFDELELPQLRLPRPDPRPRGPEDVEEPRQRRRPLGGDLRPRRRRLPLVLPDHPAALGRLPLLGRHGRRVGAPVPAHPLEHLLLLGPLRQRRGPRAAGLRAAPPSRPTTSTAGRSRACRRRSRPCASGWTTSTAPPPAGRSPSSSRSSPTGTCGSRGGASGRATAPPSRPCATACWRPRRCWRPFTPFLADEIHLNLAGGALGRVRRAPRLGPPARLPGGRPGPRRPRAGGRRWRRCG